jgi:hypothetical protein
MSDGILFYSNYKNPLPLFVVALYSLRKYHGDNVHIVLGENTPEFFPEILNKQNYVSYSFSKRHYDKCKSNIKWHEKKQLRLSRLEWKEKPFIIKHESPYDRTLYYDCDHVFYKDIDRTVFDEIEKNKLVTSISKSYASRVSEITQSINKLNKSKFKIIEKVNGGCVGHLKEDEECIDRWIKHMHLYTEKGCWILRPNAEEFGLATAVKEGFGSRISENYSYGYPRKGIVKNPDKNVIGVHYCAERYSRGELWNRSFMEAFESDFLNIRSQFNDYCQCNTHLEKLKNGNPILSYMLEGI